MDCARVMRGTSSSANAVTPCALERGDRVGARGGLQQREQVTPALHLGDLLAGRLLDLADEVGAGEDRRGIAEGGARLLIERRRGSRPGGPRRARPSRSTPAFTSRPMLSGMSATRVSPGARSRGTPIFIRAEAWGSGCCSWGTAETRRYGTRSLQVSRGSTTARRDSADNRTGSPTVQDAIRRLLLRSSPARRSSPRRTPGGPWGPGWR